MKLQSVIHHRLAFLKMTFLILCIAAGCAPLVRAKDAQKPLQPHLREHAIVSMGDTARLQHMLAKARRGEPIVVGVIGGSITAGALASTEENRWANRTAQWWRDTFPHTTVTLVNAGIGATGSDIGAHRVQQDLLAKQPDFVVVEFAVNDAINAIPALTLEGLLRQILRHPQQPAVAMLFTMGREGSNVQKVHEPVGKYYGIPMVSVRNSLWPEITAGRMTDDDIIADSVHPNDLGHAYCADFLIAMLKRAYSDLPPDDALPVRPPVPKPLAGDAFEYTTMFGYKSLRAVRNKGWRSFDRGDGGGVGWEADTPGDFLEFEVKGTAISIIFYATKGDRGMVEAWVDDGDRVKMDGWFPPDWKFAGFKLVAKDLTPGKHLLRVRVLEKRNEASRGHLFQIHSVLAAGLKDK